MSWESNEPRPLSAADDPSGPSRRAPAPPRYGRALAGPNLSGTGGAMILAAFVLVLICGVLGLVNGIQRVDNGPGANDDMEAAVVIIAGVAALVAALLIWQGRTDFGGMIAIVCGVVYLVLGPDTAGLLGVLGGILALVVRRVPEAAF